MADDRRDQQQDAGAPAASLVLIDELDKAPRDLPNDLLRELEDMTFTAER